MAEAQQRMEVTSAQVFDYRREVVVELHGRTTGGEFEVISYSLTPDSDDGTRLRSADVVDARHEERVRELLGREGYVLD